MIVPIVAYGDPVLKKAADDIPADYPELKEIIANMFETMQNASGVGLAAPQIGLPIRVFVVDAGPFEDEEPELKDFRKAFINARIVHEEGEKWAFTEGCLSIPDIREDVNRHPEITLRYVDENFEEHTEKFKGLLARVIQHEYDHIEGKLFTDYLSPLKKRMLQKRLTAISKGEIKVDYKMSFPKPAKARRRG